MAVLDRRRELADFLRNRRARADLRAAGVVRGPRRRTPGLRREELAQLAGLSVDWYVRLEQGRDVNPSRDTLEALARALRLDDDERGHLFYLARAEPAPPRRTRTETVDLALSTALSTLAAPAMILGRRFDILAWNPGAVALMCDFAEIAPAERNTLWLTFVEPRFHGRYADPALVERELVAAFRANTVALLDDPDVHALVTALLDRSPSFQTLWARHDVRTKQGGTKRFVTPTGLISLTWHTLLAPSSPDQFLIFYTPTTPTDATLLSSLPPLASPPTLR